MIDRKKRDKKFENEELAGFESTTVGVYRTAATIKGGRRFSFGSLVVVGDRHGQVGIGYGKANEVPPAIQKAEKDARRSLKKVPLREGTLPHTVVGRFESSRVKLVPASPGTGVVAGAAVRAVLELAGVRDCLTKCYGSTNEKNVVKATLNALLDLRSKEDVEALRGVTLGETHVDDLLARGQAFMPTATSDKPATAPVNELDAGKGGKGKGKGRGGRGGGGGRGRGGGRSEPKPEAKDAPKTDDAPAESKPEAEAKTENSES